MSETSDDKIMESVRNFYDQLTNETSKSKKKTGCSTLSLSCKPNKSLKVDAGSVNLSQTLEKITQKEIDKRKAIRKKNRKANNNLRGKSAGKTFVKQKSQKSSVDLIPTEENESISESVKKYGMDGVLESSFESEKLYISCKPQDDGSLLVTLFPNSKIYLVGYYSLQLILGDVSVLGYKFKKNEKHVIYSPASHSLLPINCLGGCEVKKLESQKIKDLCIPLEYVEDLDISTDQPVVIVKMYRYCSNITQIFDESLVTEKEEKLDMCLWKETLAVQLVEDINKCRVPLFCESEEWTSYIEEFQACVELNDKRIFVVTGGKSVGKSTFLKYIINRFLSILEVSHVACIDLDPGQPEFSLPGCLTLSVCSSPLLGPSFSHHEHYVYSFQKQILLGDILVNHMMNEYLNIVSHLFSIYLEKFSDIPLVVNTMGFTAVTGYDIMIDILRILEPSHVINIESSQSNKNYPTPLTTQIVSSTNRGILRNNRKFLNYHLVTFKSVSKETRKTKSKIARELTIMGYLSLLWKEYEKNLTCYTFKRPLIVNWKRVAVHIHRSSVPPSHVLLAINGSLVALCSMGKEFLYRAGPYHPLRIHYSISSLLSCECLGWGVVRGVDPITQEISIYTPLDAAELRKVNVIAVPNVQLPLYFRNYFSTISGNSPYIKNT
ncbi:UNVERIFIED_CONTAM: hypothetical protein RMT77_006737 [Armadillidium vulgare]